MNRRKSESLREHAAVCLSLSPSHTHTHTHTLSLSLFLSLFARFLYLATHRATSIPFSIYKDWRVRRVTRPREDERRTGNRGEPHSERQTEKRRARRMRGGRKKSEAVEGKKEDSRRFNTR